MLPALTIFVRLVQTVDVDSGRDSSCHQTRLLAREARAEAHVSVLDTTWVTLHEHVLELLPIATFTTLLESFLRESRRAQTTGILERLGRLGTYFLTGSFWYSRDIIALV